jgi:hypothetical protein
MRSAFSTDTSSWKASSSSGHASVRRKAAKGIWGVTRHPEIFSDGSLQFLPELKGLINSVLDGFCPDASQAGKTSLARAFAPMPETFFGLQNMVD